MGDGVRNHSPTHESCQRCINDTAMLPSWLGNKYWLGSQTEGFKAKSYQSSFQRDHSKGSMSKVQISKYTIKKVKDSESYEFLLANKKFIVNVEVFRKILDICPRVEGKEFTPVQDDDDILTFLTDLGYKGPLHKHTNMFVDHMHQPWRTLAAIINKCLSGKTTSNDKLRKSRIDILKEKKSRRKTMPFPRFTKVIINHFLKQHKSLTNLKYQHYHTIKDDGIQSESYQMFIKYSTGEIPPKKSRCEGSQGKKTIDVSQETVDVSEESEPESAKKRTIVEECITEAEEEEATRQVHATYVRIVTEFVPEPAKKKTGSRSTRSLVIQDTPKLKPATSKLKLKCIPSLTPEEQLTADTMQPLKESKKPNRRQPGVGGSSEGTGITPGVPDESTVVSDTSSEGTGTKVGVPDEEKVSTKEKVILEWGSEQESEYSEEELSEEEEIDWIDSEVDDEKTDDTDDDKSINLEMTDDEVLQGKEQVNDDEDEEMTDPEVEESRNGNEEDTDTAKADAEKTKKAKDDSKKAELPPTSSSLSVSSGFGDQFLKLSSDTFLIGSVKDTTDAKISSLLDIKIQFEVPHIQSLSVLKVHVFVISEPSVLTPVQETPSAAPVTTLPPPSVSTIPPTSLQQSTTPIPSPPITTDAPTITTVVPESDALSTV
ncbi:hypothetical protein Tco_0511121 [Tanacetum coccineum]